MNDIKYVYYVKDECTSKIYIKDIIDTSEKYITESQAIKHAKDILENKYYVLLISKSKSQGDFPIFFAYHNDCKKRILRGK